MHVQDFWVSAVTGYENLQKKKKKQSPVLNVISFAKEFSNSAVQMQAGGLSFATLVCYIRWSADQVEVQQNTGIPVLVERTGTVLRYGTYRYTRVFSEVFTEIAEAA